MINRSLSVLAAAVASLAFSAGADDGGRGYPGPWGPGSWNWGGGGPSHGGPRRCDVSQAQLDKNTKTAIAYYTLAFNDGLPRLAVQRYVGVDRSGNKTYTQHNPFAQDGPEAFIAFVEFFKTLNPGLHVDIKRTIAQCDLVMTHAHITTGQPDDLGNAAMDIFRFDKSGKIVEHWDAVQPVEAVSANDNTQF